jgi:hypothetical protein
MLETTEHLLKRHFSLSDELRRIETFGDHYDKRIKHEPVSNQHTETEHELCRRAYEEGDQLALNAIYNGYVDAQYYTWTKVNNAESSDGQ